MNSTIHQGQLAAPPVDSLPLLLEQAGIPVRELPEIQGPVRALAIEARFWGKAAAVAAANHVRWCACWGEHRPPEINIFALLAGQDGHLLLQTTIPDIQGELPSQTPSFPAANRPERYLQEMFGMRFTDHPDPRRWMRHQAWDAGQYPLRKDFPLAGTAPEQTPPDCEYPFIPAEGEGVYEIPVGPVHAGIIEPGHFRFQAMGEAILSLEEHLGYVHKGIEKCAEGRDSAGLVRLAARVSGDSTVAHAWAACQAGEHAIGLPVPRRAVVIRAILAERERVANHLGDMGACCNDVGFAFAHVHFSRLRELWQRHNAAVFGHRLLMDVVIPGGVTRDIGPEQISLLQQANEQLRHELDDLLPLLYEYPSLQDRLRTTGILSLDKARTLGALGFVARASGECWDLRRDAPYAPYENVTVAVPFSSGGASSNRVHVRGGEILVSLDLLDTFLAHLPAGDICRALPPIPATCCGVGCIEGWRGEIIAYVRLEEGGIVSRYFPRDPSWLNWPALEVLILGEIVPDFPLCNKSVNGSYSGHDL
ncbi:NADH-quinone oxidoreductase subunit C [uncultured Desulfobulbus sp.]|uniref:hydrogenase large subunit n=1 Tax=uncultured Desulfobulbus sp. TaxID=239745 RepID=UPI0029C99E48|nr:NADH-quinone oxidoreductase subunit C [uncultured Desulfobulbus sp.]